MPSKPGRDRHVEGTHDQPDLLSFGRHARPVPVISPGWPVEPLGSLGLLGKAWSAGLSMTEPRLGPSWPFGHPNYLPSFAKHTTARKA
jgi:hypothetical protein